MIIFCGTVEVDDVKKTIGLVNAAADKTGSTVVLFDAEKIAGFSHIESAVMHAKRSFEEGKAIARSLSMEILVYVSGQRQCSLASKFGLHEGENSVYVLVLDGDEEKSADLVKEIVKECEPFSPNKERLKAEFGITNAEMEAAGENRIEELVIERVALVDAWK
ncbi:MAG: hypothetical protein IKT36_01140 [Methanocorpusculum sp.]|nr:hypothetical protein [Methanocorpusculum sp.]MBR5142228.1 hypothetical protein [Methanocorpusculum sp.]MBR5450298.1 hypothetical protein [Methanocorpusculum sp.]